MRCELSEDGNSSRQTKKKAVPGTIMLLFIVLHLMRAGNEGGIGLSTASSLYVECQIGENSFELYLPCRLGSV